MIYCIVLVYHYSIELPIFFCLGIQNIILNAHLSVVWCGVVWCGVVWYGMVWYGIALHSIVLYMVGWGS